MQIVLSEGHIADVQVHFSESSLKLSVCKMGSITDPNVSMITSEIIGDSSPFRAALSESIIGKALAIHFRNDWQSFQSFLANKTVSIPISSRDPAQAFSGSFGSNIEQFQLNIATAAEMIRPMFLKESTDEKLFRFQVQGVQWLLDHKRAILADDMGLGKTVQAIVAIRKLIRAGELSTVLVVCPRSLLSNWEDEIHKWAPELTCLRVVPSASVKDDVWNTVLHNVHVIITNYEQLRRPEKALLRNKPDLILADEAHHIRNVGAQVSSGIRSIEAEWIWMLTGTPIEKDATDLTTLLSTIEPDRFVVSEARMDPSSLIALAKPYVLRRLKSEVLSDLPELIENKETVELLPQQRKAYRRVLEKLRKPDESSVLGVINELRTICDYDKVSGESVKVERIADILESISAINEKAIVFSYLLEPLNILANTLEQRLKQRGFTFLLGEMSPSQRESNIRSFRDDPCVTALLCSTRVGSEGLTLTEANHVIFLNEWWNPSANSQAQDRVLRIGQTRGVMKYSFRCRNTIEEKLEEILQEKTDTFLRTVDAMAESSSIDDSISDLSGELRDSLLE